LDNPFYVTVWFSSFSCAIDYLFNFRQSLYFEEYILTDTNCNTSYYVKNCDKLDALELHII
jgi:hypothetical protein